MSAQSEIKDYVEGFYDGPHATPKESDHGPIFLGIKNVTPDGRLDFSEIRHVSPEEFHRWTKRVVPQKDDIVFSYEATLHRYALIPEGFIGCLGRRMALIRPDRAKINPRFLHYYMLSSAWRKEAEASIISGATVDRIPLTKVPNFKVDFPPLTQQEIIAEILSCYDDLIENNKRRIELLEESARQLYKEWFVRFRFPGHEHVKIIDGVPEGWDRSFLEKYIKFSNGKALRNPEEGNVPVYGSNGIIGSSNRSLFDSGVVIGRVGAYCGSTMLSLSKFWGSDNTIIAQSPSERFGLYYLYFLLTKLDLNRFAGGAAQPLLTQSNLKKVEAVIPSQLLCQEFDEFTKDVFSQINNLDEQNKKLAQARDVLLPKLMSGEIAV